MPRVAQSVEELFPLIEFCKAGDLRAVSKWIEEGNPLNPPAGKKTRRRTPLQVAIEKGFLTLTEKLLDAGADPLANGNALLSAIDHKRADIVALLIERGIPIDSDLFIWACSSGDPQIIQTFLDRGADPLKGFPFYHAFTSCLRPVLGVYKTHVEKAPELRVQANMALCHYAKEGNLRCVSLLLWAGARQDQEVPNFQEPDRDFLDDCALVQAAGAGHLDVLKRMKPENYPQWHLELVEACWHRNTTEILDYLRKLDFPAVVDQIKASKSLEHLLWQLSWDTDTSSPFGGRNPSRLEATLHRIEYLVSKGAKWMPNEEYGLRDSRRKIRKLEPDKILRLFSLFKEHQVVVNQFMEDLVNTAAMRAHLGPKYIKAISQLFHPGEIKIQSLPVSTPSLPSPRVKLTLPQLKAKSEDFLWDMIRSIPSVRFWQTEIHDRPETQRFKNYLRLGDDDEFSLHEIVQAAVAKVNREASSFELSYEGHQYRRIIEPISIRIKPGHDWQDMIEEAWKRVEHPNPRFLTPPALALFSWLKESNFPSEWLKDTTLSWKAGFRGKKGVVIQHLRELRHKLGSNFHYESRGNAWNEVLEHRLWIEGEISLEGPIPRKAPKASLNPVIDVNIEYSNKSNFDYWRDFIYQHLLKIRPIGDQRVLFLWIETKKELLRVFPRFAPEHYQPGRKLAEFWRQIPLHSEISLEYNFESEAPAWFLNLIPKVNWEITFQELDKTLRQPTLQQKYGLSDEAAKLLEWIQGLRPDQFDGRWTPLVEDAREKKIGLTCPRDEANFPAYLQILIDELNEKTSYDLTLQPWHDYSRLKTKIRVAQKSSEQDQLVRRLQLYALQNGKLLDRINAQRILEDMLR